MEHLTLTGPMAGRTFCGEPRNADEGYSHLPYATAAQVTEFVRNHIDCPNCRAVYSEVYEVKL